MRFILGLLLKKTKQYFGKNSINFLDNCLLDLVLFARNLGKTIRWRHRRLIVLFT